ncbi:ATP-dependent DNA helicase RecQ [Leptolyngbya sp. NIES-3755]|nr:ATP-dependent DNA helicase RecQ [Leptolyngbya sp. NIES-3755]
MAKINRACEFAELVGNSDYGWRLLLGKMVTHYRLGQGRVNSWNYQDLEIGIYYEISSGSRYVRYEKTRFSQEFIEINPSVYLSEIEEALQTEQKQEIKQLARQEAQRQEAARRELERQEAVKRQACKLTLLQILRRQLESNFLNTYHFYKTACSQYITEEEYQAEKVRFVRSWFKQHFDFEPDVEQADAIASVENHVQVIARAGSGKTSTLVNRALFLQKHCGVSPDEMLLLAFNRDAVGEIRTRITQKLQGSIPHVMTFHALAYRVVQPEGNLLYDEANGVQSRSRLMQEDVIASFVQNPKYHEQIRALMMARFRQDWEQLESSGYNKNPQEMLQYRRSLIAEAIDGTFVKSYGEKVIANFLFEHGIEYHYEYTFKWEGRNYRPDFTLKQNKIIIEYFGLQGDPDYDELSNQKRKYWRDRPNWKLLEFTPEILRYEGEEVFCERLKQSLERCDIRCERLSEEEIWKRIKACPITRFTQVVVGFVQRCRKLSLTPAQLAEKIQAYSSISLIEKQFLELVQIFYKAYLERLQVTGDEDFDGLMQNAAQVIAEGKTTFHYQFGEVNLKQLRYVFIDEYQDFSNLFHQLISAIQAQNSQARFFCVGDDWQAINGFAGSDLYFYQSFGQHFRPSSKLSITTNYRSMPIIVKLGNDLMQGLGTPAHAYHHEIGKVEIADLETFEPTSEEREKHRGDDFTPAVLRLVKRAIQEEKEVVLLSRKNTLPCWINYGQVRQPFGGRILDRFLKLIHAHLPEDSRKAVTISTTHGYKGLEKKVVIILDAVFRSYPLLHPDLGFTRVLGDSIDQTIAEEKRLFYVALTRAVEQVFILTERTNRSPFLDDLERQETLPILNWSNYLPTDLITVRVGNQHGRGGQPTHAIKHLLKSQGYEWKKNVWAAWHRDYPAQNFSVREFFEQASWSQLANGVEVRFCDAGDEILAIYLFDSGQETCVFDNLPTALD